MKMSNVVDVILNACQYIACALLADIEQVESAVSIVMMVFTIISTLIITIPKLVKKFKEWHEKAMKDGKIDKNEVQDLIDDFTPIVGDAVDKIKDQTKKGGK